MGVVFAINAGGCAVAPLAAAVIAATEALTGTPRAVEQLSAAWRSRRNIPSRETVGRDQEHGEDAGRPDEPGGSAETSPAPHLSASVCRSVSDWVTTP
jgi:hypothetical protein